MNMGRGTARPEEHNSRSQAQARVYAISRQEAIAAPDVVSGKIYVHGHEACALIDPGSTHSFISWDMASHLHKTHEHLGYNLNVSTPLGGDISVDRVYKDCLVWVDKAELYADLILLPLRDFDVILGMDWLTRHHAVVNCFNKEVVLESPGQPRVVFYGERRIVPDCLIYAIKAFTLIKRGCEAYLAYVADIESIEKKLENIPVVGEFPDVFPDDLPSLPPDRDTEFTIEVIPGTAPISIPPYRMAPVELKELKTQLQELLDK